MTVRFYTKHFCGVGQLCPTYGPSKKFCAAKFMYSL